MMLFAFRSFHFIISVPSPSGILCFFFVWWVWSRPFHLSPIIKSSSKFICISSLLSSSLLSSPPPPFRSYAAWFQSKLPSTIHIPYIPTLPKVLQSCAKSQYNPIVDGPPPYEVKQSQTRDLLEEVTVYSTTVFLLWYAIQSRSWVDPCYGDRWKRGRDTTPAGEHQWY